MYALCFKLCTKRQVNICSTQKPLHITPSAPHVFVLLQWLQPIDMQCVHNMHNY